MNNWQYVHDREVDLIREDGWMCESHPGHHWPDCPIEKDCPGPGMPWKVEGRAAIEALTKGPQR